MHLVVAIGANLGHRQAAIASALERCAEALGPILARSTFRETPPLTDPASGSVQQSPYLNGAVLIRTEHSPEECLRLLLSIERSLGRERQAGKRWQPRTIDLDMICAGDLVISSPSLKLPHPELHNRDFVLGPLRELLPEWRHPVLHRTVEELWLELRERQPGASWGGYPLAQIA